MAAAWWEHTLTPNPLSRCGERGGYPPCSRIQAEERVLGQRHGGWRKLFRRANESRSGNAPSAHRAATGGFSPHHRCDMPDSPSPIAMGEGLG